MNWLTDFVRPKIKALMRRQEVPDNLWSKCPSCEHMLFHRDLVENMNVCHHCNYHMRVNVHERLDQLFDHKSYTKAPSPKVVQDPLKFKDSKRYTDRLKEYRQKTGQEDAVIVAYGQIQANPFL
jgi:acetyl-CoA carboxylase carboxyl transferase subunit beta